MLSALPGRILARPALCVAWSNPRSASHTHGVFDPQLAVALRGVAMILHAGDVGHHGMHAEVLAKLQEVAPVMAVRRAGHLCCLLRCMICARRTEPYRLYLQEVMVLWIIRGNVDHSASLEDLPEVQVLRVNGWRILMTHICGMPPKDSPTAKLLVTEHRPNIVVFGHSHVYGDCRSNDVWYINSGAAGPARFKLKRTAALLHLPEKAAGALPHLNRIELEGKAPPRLRRDKGSKPDVSVEAAKAGLKLNTSAGSRAKKRKHVSSTDTC